MTTENEIADQLILQLSELVKGDERGFRAVMDGRVGVFDRDGDGDLRVEITSARCARDFGLAFDMPTPKHDFFRDRRVPPAEFRDWADKKGLYAAGVDSPVFDDLDIFRGDFDEQVTWALQSWVLKGGASEVFRTEILRELPSLRRDVVKALGLWLEERAQ